MISSIETKTSSIGNAGMKDLIYFSLSSFLITSFAETNTKIEILITCGSSSSKTCSATLDDAKHTSKDLFIKGATDTFTSSMIGDCNGFACNTELKTKIIHHGDDGWQPEYIRY